MNSNKKFDYSFNTNFNQAVGIAQFVLFPVFAHLRISNKGCKSERCDILFIIFLYLMFVFWTIKSYYWSHSIFAAPLISSFAIQLTVEYNVLASDIAARNRYPSMQLHGFFSGLAIFFASFIGMLSAIHAAHFLYKGIGNAFVGVVGGLSIPCFSLLLEMDATISCFLLVLVLSSVNCNIRSKLRFMSVILDEKDGENLVLHMFIYTLIMALMICLINDSVAKGLG